MRKESPSSVQIFPKFDKEELIQKLKKKIEELTKKNPLSHVVLFGSYAHGNYTAGSDINLLVVYKGKERKDAFATVKKTLSISLLEPHVYSENGYETLRSVIAPVIAKV